MASSASDIIAPVSCPVDPTDLQLIQRALNGDSNAFGDLYEKNLNAIYRYLFYRLGDGAECEDLAETVFIKAWQALETYNPQQAPFLTWLYGIAHNQLIDHLRAAKPASALDDRLADTDSRNPEVQADRFLQVAQLTSVFTQLDDLDQQVLSLRFIAGLSHAETAAVLGRSIGSVRVLQHRALESLRTLFGGLNG